MTTNIDTWAQRLQLRPEELDEFTQWWNTNHIVALTGNDLDDVIDAFSTHPTPRSVQVWLDEGGVKFKFNQGTWSPALGHQT